MEVVMNLIKRHKGLAVLGGLALILVIIIICIFARMIFSTSSSEYGQRLDDLVKIDSKVTNDIVGELEDIEQVSSAKIRIQGRIIYTIISYVEGTSKDKAKSIASDTISKYSEEVLEDYDFSFLLQENVISSDDEEKTGFVIAGTKITSATSVSWTK